MADKLWNIDEVAAYLGISHDDVKSLVEQGILPAYRIAGSFLRFDPALVEERKDQLVKSLTRSIKKDDVESESKYTMPDKLKDFLYFNDFYLFSTLVIVILLFLIFK